MKKTVATMVVMLLATLTFAQKMNIIEIQVEIELNQLPTGILDYVKKSYAGKQVKEGAKITDAKGKVTYEVEIKGVDLIFDSKGKFIKEFIG